jgi:hypothetical protein
MLHIISRCSCRISWISVAFQVINFAQSHWHTKWHKAALPSKIRGRGLRAELQSLGSTSRYPQGNLLRTTTRICISPPIKVVSTDKRLVSSQRTTQGLAAEGDMWAQGESCYCEFCVGAVLSFRLATCFASETAERISMKYDVQVG